MKIAVVGTGGVGGYYGSLLLQTGHDVAFLARGAHLQAMRERGLTIDSVLSETVTLSVHATDKSAEIGDVDLVLFTVKSYDTVSAAELLPPLLGKKTGVLTLQNGVDNVDALVERAGRSHVLGGLAYIFCHIAAPGVIRHSGGLRRIVFGELDGQITPRAQAVHDAFVKAGVPIELSTQIPVAMWEKYLFITAQGGMTALTRQPIGVIREHPETFTMFMDASEEVAAVGRAHGVPIPDGVRERVRRFAESLEPGSYSSLYQDLVHGRRMELEALPGNVVRLGQRYGVPTPVCRAVYAALLPYARAAERGRPLG